MSEVRCVAIRDQRTSRFSSQPKFKLRNQDPINAASRIQIFLNAISWHIKTTVNPLFLLRVAVTR